MAAAIDALRAWFDGLAPRERIMVGAAVVVLLVAIVVVGGIRPITESRKTAVAGLADREAVLADIVRVAARFGPQAGGGAATSKPSNESLVVLMDRTTRARGLAPYLKRNEPDGNASIRLRFENVPFDDVASWLAELQATQAITVVSASVDPGDSPGRVTANLQLSRAGAKG
jgi:general secretion pathway protein M